MKNLATAVQVSIDTAVQHCEVKFSGRELGYRRRCSRSCSGFVLVTWGAEVAMVEPTWFGSVSIRKDERGVGWRMEGPPGIVGGLAALRVHYSLVVCIFPCFCGFREFHGRRGANKPTLSAGGDE